MTRHLKVTLGLLSIFVSNALADEAESPKLGKSFFPDAVRFVTATSDDRQVSVMIFDNFTLATPPGKGELVNAETRSFSVTNEIEAKDAVTVTLDIRGFVSAQAEGSAAVLVHAGGETTLIDLPKATAASTSKPRKEGDVVYAQAKASAESAEFKVNARPKLSENYYARVNATLAKGEPLQATIVLLVDRLPDADSSALITVDSIDVSVKSVPAEKLNSKAEKKTENAKDDKEPTESNEKKEPVIKKEKDSEKKTAEPKEDATRKPEDKKDSDKKPIEKSGEKTSSN